MKSILGILKVWKQLIGKKNNIGPNISYTPMASHSVSHRRIARPSACSTTIYQVQREVLTFSHLTNSSTSNLALNKKARPSGQAFCVVAGMRTAFLFRRGGKKSTDPRPGSSVSTLTPDDRRDGRASGLFALAIIP